MLSGLETVALEAELGAAETKMGVTMNRIRKDYIRGTAHVRCFEIKPD